MGKAACGGDFAHDRIVPDCIRAIQSGRPIMIRIPHSVRPYQHVLEALFAYLMVARRQYEGKGFAGCYNVGPENADCVTTGELATMFCEAWGGGAVWENKIEPDAPHEDSFLKLDCSKLKAAFDWRLCANCYIWQLFHLFLVSFLRGCVVAQGIHIYLQNQEGCHSNIRFQ